MQLEALPEVIPEELLHYGDSGWAESERFGADGIAALSSSDPQATEDAHHAASTPSAAPVTVWQRNHSGEELTESDGGDMHSDFSDDSNVQYTSDNSNMADPYSTDPAASRSSVESFSSEWDSLPPRSVPATNMSNGVEEHCRGGGGSGVGGGDLAETVGGIMGASLWHSSLLDQQTPPLTTCSDGSANTAEDTQVSGLLGSNLNSTPLNGNSRFNTEADDPNAGAGEAQPMWSPAAGLPGDGGGDTVVVSKQLLLRYYQLENFAAEYFEWFLQRTQPRQQNPVDDSSLTDVQL